jgi:TRAP-type uncharacterized transport system fused permease subunit
MSTGFQAMKLAIAGYLVPFFFLYKPGLALMGSPLHVALAVLEGTVATVLIAMAVEAYFIRPMNWVERIAILVAGLCLFSPGLDNKYDCNIDRFACSLYSLGEKSLIESNRSRQ